jgi:hypothetical protein
MQLLKSSDEVSTDRAADAAVVHFNHILLSDIAIVSKKPFINAHLTKLILDDRDPLAMIFCEDVVQERRLASPQEARDDGNRCLGLVFVFALQSTARVIRPYSTFQDWGFSSNCGFMRMCIKPN